LFEEPRCGANSGLGQSKTCDSGTGVAGETLSWAFSWWKGGRAELVVGKEPS